MDAAQFSAQTSYQLLKHKVPAGTRPIRTGNPDGGVQRLRQLEHGAGCRAGLQVTQRRLGPSGYELNAARTPPAVWLRNRLGVVEGWLSSPMRAMVSAVASRASSG
jgi:hypothetical protein